MNRAPKRGVGAHLSVNRVRRRYDTATRVEGSVDARLGDGDRLLLHDLVNRDSVDI